MSIGRRSSSDSGWSWSSPPNGPRRTPPTQPLVPLAAWGGLIAFAVALALLIIWLSNEDDNSPADAASTATPTAAVTPTPPPTPTATPAPTATPSPTPISSDDEPRLSLAVWDGSAWQFSPSPAAAAYREGEAVPFLLRIDQARPGDAYPTVIRYDCNAFDFLTAYDRDHGSEPALASGGPGSAIVDSTAPVPDDPATPADDRDEGSFSLWGGSLTRVDAPLPSTACTGEKSLSVTPSAARDTLFLMWAAQLSDAASDGDVPVRLAVLRLGGEELSIEIDPESVGPAQP